MDDVANHAMIPLRFYTARSENAGRTRESLRVQAG